MFRIPSVSAAILAFSTIAAGAATSDADSPLTATWENTVTTTVAQRLDHGSTTLGYGYPGGAGSAGAYDGAAFTPARLDLLSELAVDYQAFGFRTSIAARLEQADANGEDSEYGTGCYPPFGEDSDLAFGHCGHVRGEAEVRDAFIHGSTAFDPDQRLSFRFGRQTVIWGESVYFPGNGIAAGQAPIDTSMIEKITGYQADTVFLPVGQLAVSWQPGGGVAIDVYDQFEWRRSRIGSLGDYVDAADANLLGLAAGMHVPSFLVERDGSTPLSLGQYGLALKWQRGDVDYGLYALRYDAKDPTLHVELGAGLGAAPDGAVVGTYREEFARGIEIYGASMAGSAGPASYGAEISARRNMPLVTGPIVDASGGGYDYPAGDTLQAQASWSYITPPLPGISDGAKWTGEVAANRLLRVTANPDLRSLDRTSSAAAMRTVFEPQFLGVLPRVDLKVPISLGVNLFGLSAIDPQMNRGTGDVSLALVATHGGTWTGALNLTHYLGTAKNVFPYDFVMPGRRLSEADFVSFSVQRSF